MASGTMIRMVLFHVAIKDFAAAHNHQRAVVYFGNESANISFLPEDYLVVTSVR
jgi:hypothetical protein